jgi:hypothetical protein
VIPRNDIAGDPCALHREERRCYLRESRSKYIDAPTVCTAVEDVAEDRDQIYPAGDQPGYRIPEFLGKISGTTLRINTTSDVRITYHADFH